MLLLLLSLARAEAPLDSADPRARILAARALASDASGLEPLAQRLTHESDPMVRRAIQDALARLPLSEAQLLEALAHSSVTGARAFAAHELGASPSDSAVTALLAATKDADVVVRTEVYRALGAAGNRIAIETLMRAAVRDPSPAGRDAATAAAELLAAAPTVPTDVPLELTRLRDGKRDDRIAATRKLGETGDRRALDPLVAAALDPDADLQRAALSALGRLGDARAVAPLVDLLPKTTGRTRYAVLAALASLRDESSVDAITHLLSDPDPAARQLAVRALAWIAPHDLFTRLAPAQSDPIEEVRGEVLKAVDDSHDPARVAALLRALDDASPFVRAEAVRLCAEAGVTDKIPTLLNDSDALVRLAAADAVAVLRPDGAAALLRKAASRAKEKPERDRMNELAAQLDGTGLPPATDSQ